MEAVPSAARYEQQRNAKIDGEGITDYQKTYDLGSIFDAENFTNEELGEVLRVRQAVQSGQIDQSSGHGFAENKRSKYGYSGGEDGSQYIPIEKAKQASDPAPTFSYQSAPAYVNRYQDLIDELKGKILDQDPFSYNAEQDPLYQQYRQSYTRGGERAMQDTLGQLSARTGGLASSYAGSAAQQQYDNYMGALADKIPELQQLAYEMYQDEGNRQRLNLQMIAALEQEDYGKYQDLLGQYNADRSFSYGQYRDQIADRRYDDETAYNRGVYADERDYNRGIYADETAYNRGLYADETDYDRKLQRAKLLAEVGDFSGYQALGFTEEEIGRLQAAFLLQHPEFSSLYPSDQTAAGTGGGFPATDPSGWGGGGRYTYSLGSDAGGAGAWPGTAGGTGSTASSSRTGTPSQSASLTAPPKDGGDKPKDKGSGGSKYAGDLGIGSVSDSVLDQLIRDKKVETYFGPDGREYVHWVTGWNNRNYGG